MIPKSGNRISDKILHEKKGRKAGSIAPHKMNKSDKISMAYGLVHGPLASPK
jgi:hypothetical protein